MEEQTAKTASDTSPVECNGKNVKEKRRTSILKPPKIRTPLKELQFTSSQEVKDDTTARLSRRVSFGHFHVRKFGYENGDVCDSVYSFESSKSESSTQPNNSTGENDEVSAANSRHHFKNTLPECTNFKNDFHMKKNMSGNASKHKCAEPENKSSVTDTGVCSLKKMTLKQMPDAAPGFSDTDNVPPRHSSDVFNSKTYAVRKDSKDNDYFEKGNLVDPNFVVSGDMQWVHEQSDIKQLQGLAKCGREQCEQKNQADAYNCEQHLNSATVTDMELADSYCFGCIECKEESLLGRKQGKNVDTTEKSSHFAAESDMELTKVTDTFCCVEVLNTVKDKSISLYNTETKNNLICSSDRQTSKNAKYCNSMTNVSQQLNATKRFSTNNGMDITEVCGILHSDIANDGTADILSLSRLSVDEEDCDRHQENTSKYSTKNANPSEFSEQLFINESMEQTLTVARVLNESDMDYCKAIKCFQRNDNVSCHLEYSDDNVLPISDEECSGLTLAAELGNENKLTDHIGKCTEAKIDDTNNFNTSKTILMCVDMESSQNICNNDQENSFMQFTRVVDANIQDGCMQDPLVPLGNKHSNPTEQLNTETKNESAMEESSKYDMCNTQIKSIQDTVAAERRTDVCITGTSSSKVFASEDKQNDHVSSHILDTKPDHPLILKTFGNEAVKRISHHTECKIKTDTFTDSSVFMLSKKINHASYSKERSCEGTMNNSIKQIEHSWDRSVKCNSPCQIVVKDSNTCTVSSTSPKIKSGIIQQGKQNNNMGNSICSIPSNSPIIRETIEFCVTPISETENVARKRGSANEGTPISETENITRNGGSANEVLSKYSERQSFCSNRSKLQHLPPWAAEDHLVTDSKSLHTSGNGMLHKKRRSSEKDTREGTKSRKKQSVSTDHVSDKQCSQNTTEPSGLAVETKAFNDRYAIVALHVESGVENTVMSEEPAVKVVGVPNETHSLQANNNISLLAKINTISPSLPQPSDPNTKLNFSCPAKSIVFNNQPECGLEFTSCETSSVADCKKQLSGCMLLNDKRNTDSQLPENEGFKSNTNDGDIERNKTYEQKKYIRDSEKSNNTDGTSTNMSEVNVPHTSLREDKNSQYIEDTGFSQKNYAAYVDDKNNLLSATDSSDETAITFKRRRRYETNTISLSFTQKGIKIRDHCTETDDNEHKSVVVRNAELSRDPEETAIPPQSRYDESHTSVKEGDDQTLEGIKILSSSGNECSGHEADAAIHNADKTFQSWYCGTKASIADENSSPSGEKSNSSTSCQSTSGTTKCSPAQTPDGANKVATLDNMPGRNEEVGRIVTQDSSLRDFKMSEGYTSPEIQLDQAREKMSVVHIDSTSNYLIKNREQDTFSESCLVSSHNSGCLKQFAQGKENSSIGKEIEIKQFNYNNSVERLNVDAKYLNVTSETKNSHEPEGKCHSVNNLMAVSRPLAVSEPTEINILCEADHPYSNTQSQMTPKIGQGSHTVTNIARDSFPVVQSTEKHMLSMDRARDIPPEGLSAREYDVAAFIPPVSSPMKYTSVCSRSVSTARNSTSTAESPKIRRIVGGEGGMGISPVICTGSQNSRCGSFNNEVAVHSETLYSTAMKMRYVTEKEEVTVVGVQEEKLTSPMENKSKKLQNLIISQAERSGVLWNIRAFTQFQWIFTFLNDTLRLYIHFDTPAEEGIIQDLNFISYLTGKADEDAKFVHFVLLKKFSKNRLKTLCKDVEELPELLENISGDVHRMLIFLYEFQKVQLLYNMEMFGTRVSFNISSYKLAIYFKMNIDLSNWEQIMEDSITITQKYGHVNEAEVKNLANGVERNPYFLRNYFKAIQQYIKILERFGC